MNPKSDIHWQIIGSGNIGRILAFRLRYAGVPRDRVSVSDIEPARAEAVGREADVLAGAPGPGPQVLLLTVPPKAVAKALQEWNPDPSSAVGVVSFAAAIAVARLEGMVAPGTPVARIMPNAPSLVGKGMNPIAFGSHATQSFREAVEFLLRGLGESVEVRDDQMNWCVGLTGAAMRHVLPAMEGMIQAGLEAGLDPGAARLLAGQVFSGSAALLLETDLSPAAMKALTPMKTVDEEALATLFQNAAREAQAKVAKAEEDLLGQM